MGNKYSEGKPYKVIAFVLACFSNDEQVRIIKKVAEECKNYQCKVMFFSTITDFYFDDLIDAGEKNIFDLISVERFDAIVLMSESFKQDKEQLALVKRANAAGVPIFAIDKCFAGCINLTFDYGNCFREIVEHMVEVHGFKTINFMGGMPGNSYSEERLEIYRDVLEKNGIPYDEKRVFYGYFWEDPTLLAMEQMFEDIADGMSMPEAIICANDVMALTVINFLRKKGYRVPEDVAVSGFDAIELEKYSNPRLTTGVYNIEDMIQTCLRMITQENTEIREHAVPIYNTMQIGHSCGCDGVEACHITDEMRKLKAEVHLLMKYQSEVNQMVANYGNLENLETLARAIPDYMSLLRYEHFWIGFEDTFTGMMGIADKVHLEVSEGPDKNVGVLHYESGQIQGALKDWCIMSQSEVIPGRDEFFEENDYVMVTVLHIKGTKVGYAAISFDMSQFNFLAYNPFLTNLRHMLELQKSQRQIMRIYERDQLTNLYNRSGFYKKVQRILDDKEEKELSVIFIDMDGLKKVNDTYGHAEGDEALQAIGKIIEASTAGEITARNGGDEFLIAFAGSETGKRAEEIRDLIIQGLDAYNQTSTKEYVLSASIGVFTDNIRNHTLDYFLKQADDKMYIEKSRHKKELEK